MTPLQQIKEQILTLESALLQSNPLLPTLLRTIHTALRADPEIVTLLAEEDIAIIVSGLMKQTQTVIVSAALKSPAKKALKGMTLDDL